MHKKLLKIFGIILGVLTIVLSFVVFSKSVGYYESNMSYGGDAYTGIQNAAAQAANNVQYVGEMIRFALGSQMLVMGLAMVLGSVCIRTKEQEQGAAPVRIPPVAPSVPVPQSYGQPVPQNYAPPVAEARQQPVAAVPAQWRCSRCGTVHEDGGRFCHVCGNSRV